MSQAELSKIFGKTDSVSRMRELGKTNPDADTLAKLADYFNVTTDYLLGLSDYPSRDYYIKNKAHEDDALNDLNKLPLEPRVKIFDMI